MKFKLRGHKLIIIVLLLIVIGAVVLINPFKKEVSFGLIDRCGPIMNMVSHSIGTESACMIKCKSQCGVKDLKFSRVEFKINMQGCNNCTCFCK